MDITIICTCRPPPSEAIVNLQLLSSPPSFLQPCALRLCRRSCTHFFSPSQYSHVSTASLMAYIFLPPSSASAAPALVPHSAYCHLISIPAAWSEDTESFATLLIYLRDAEIVSCRWLVCADHSLWTDILHGSKRVRTNVSRHVRCSWSSCRS